MSMPYGPDNPGQQPQPTPPAPAQPWQPAPPMTDQPPPTVAWQPAQPVSSQPWPAQPVSSQPWPAQPVSSQPWPPPPPPRQKSGGRIAAIIVGVTVPVLAVCVAAAVFVVPRVLESLPEASASPSTGPGASPSPTVDITAVPAVGACYSTSGINENVNDDAERERPLSCAEGHHLETIASGQLSGARPAVFSAQEFDLFQTCVEEAEEFLGVHWRATQTWLVLSLPSARAWRDGAHWYRCDLAVNQRFLSGAPQLTEGSLRDAALPISCVTWDVVDGHLQGTELTSCDAPHEGELAGAFSAAGTDRSNEDDFLQEIDDRCWTLVRSFLGQSTLPDSLSYWYYFPNPDDLDQSVQCLVSAAQDGRQFTASLEGIGSGAIPFA